MATKTTIEYGCDGCSEAMKRGDLRKFVLSEQKMDGEKVASAKADFCTDCERKLHDAVLGMFPDDEAEKLREIVRG